MSKFQNDAIFWVDVDKIDPNPYQPRRDFNEEGLRDLAESIRQYGVLQPLTVTRNEKTKDDGGLKVYYELIAGERRLRAAKMANLSQVPVTIRDEKEDSEVKLELAIIENLQREDLNPIERAEAFDQLADEFDFTHKEIAEKIGKSREYVSNSMRLLKLPEDVKQAVMAGKISEGHTRPILMLRDKPEKQEQLFKEIIHKDLTVRESEKIARREAQDKVRKKKNKVDPQTKALEDELSDTFGTRVKIEKKDEGGQLVIDFFSQEDLEAIVEMVKSNDGAEMEDMMEKYINSMDEDEKNKKKKQKEAGEDGNDDEKTTVSELQGADENQEVSETENQSGNLSSSPDESNKKDEALQGGSMAETLGTLIQQAKKERAQNNENSDDTTASTKSNQKQAVDTQTKGKESSSTSSSNSVNKESSDKTTRKDKVASTQPQQPAPNSQTDSNDKQDDMSFISDSQEQNGRSAEQGNESVASHASSSTGNQEKYADSTETNTEKPLEDSKQSASPNKTLAKSTTENTKEAKPAQNQESEESGANKPQKDLDTEETRKVDEVTEAGQDRTENTDQLNENETQDSNVSDQNDQDEDGQNDDDMYSVSNFSI